MGLGYGFHYDGWAKTIRDGLQKLAQKDLPYRKTETAKFQKTVQEIYKQVQTLLAKNQVDHNDLAKIKVRVLSGPRVNTKLSLLEFLQGTTCGSADPAKPSVLVQNASVEYPWTHKDGETEDERINGNKCNVAAYFAATSSTILQIAAGPNTFPGALPEDILVWGGNTRLLVKASETSLAPYTAGKKFSRVVVLNPRNSTAGGSYTWVFEVASWVLESGSLLDVIGGAPTQPGYDWIKKNIDEIKKLGFELIEEAPAPTYIKNMPVSGVSHSTGRVTTLPNQPDAVRLRFKKL